MDETIRDQSFDARGPHLYNKLLPELCDLENIANPTSKHLDQFKTKLDQSLSKIPDQPGRTVNIKLDTGSSLKHGKLLSAFSFSLGESRQPCPKITKSKLFFLQ